MTQNLPAPAPPVEDHSMADLRAVDQPLVDLPPNERLPIRWWPQIAALLLIALDLGWTIPWRQAISGLGTQAPDWKVWLMMGLVMAAAYGLALAVELLRLIRQARLIILGGLLIVSLIAVEMVLHPGSSIKSDTGGIMFLDLGVVVTAGFTLFLWQRGVSLGLEPVHPALAWRRFQFGLAALMVHTFAATQWRFPTVGFGGLTVYLFIGLLAVTLSKISYVSLTRSARKNPFDRRWIATTAGVFAATILLAASIGGLLTGQFRNLIDGLRALLGTLVVITLFVLNIPAFLLLLILEPLRPWLEGLVDWPILAPQETPIVGEAYPFFQEAQKQTGPLPLVLQMLCLWATVALIALVVFLLVRRRLNKRGMLTAEGPESLLSEIDARQQARQAFRDFLGGLANRLRRRDREAAAERVRQIYASILALCEALDRARPESATPLEFLPLLENTFPGFSGDLDGITRAYMRVRYGKYPEDPAEVLALEAAWRRLEMEGVRLRKELRSAQQSAERI